MTRAGIVIVTWNSEQDIGACLESAAGQCEDVVVVDNASQDGTRDLVAGRPGVRLIANESNRGFAAAVNQGVTALDNEMVLLLNPDAVLRTGIGDLVQACGDTQVAAAAGKLVDEHGELQKGFCVRRFPTPLTLALEVLGWNRLWPGNRVNRHYRCLDLDLDQPAAVEQPPGAFLMVRRDVWRKLDGMDEQFHPLWFEDVDFLRRARNSGYGVRFVPSVVARHRGGRSVKKLSFGCRQLYWYGSLLRYASKHFGHGGRMMVCVAVVFGSLLRMLAAIFSERSVNPIVIYGRVIWLGGVFLLRGRIRGADNSAAAGAIS